MQVLSMKIPFSVKLNTSCLDDLRLILQLPIAPASHIRMHIYGQARLGLVVLVTLSLVLQPFFLQTLITTHTSVM